MNSIWVSKVRAWDPSVWSIFRFFSGCSFIANWNLDQTWASHPGALTSVLQVASWWHQIPMSTVAFERGFRFVVTGNRKYYFVAFLFPPCLLKAWLVALSAWIPVSLVYWRLSWLLPSLGGSESSCCWHWCAGFCVDFSFQLLWVNTEDSDCIWEQ